MQSSLLLIPMAFGLGVRHGLDLDHLATIDAITRTMSAQKFLAKCVGILFSLGHGLVVMIVSMIIGSGVMHWQLAPWLTTFGAITSIVFLFVFGILNLLNISLRATLIGKIIGKNTNPLWIICTGALFAISFDTLSQVALFAISAAVVAGCLYSCVLGLVFMLGMMAADGFNGWIVSVLIQRADTLSWLLSRCLGVAIASFSLITGAVGLLKLCAL